VSDGRVVKPKGRGGILSEVDVHWDERLFKVFVFVFKRKWGVCGVDT